MSTTKISLELARRIVLNAQLLADTTDLSPGKTGVAQVIEKLGYVQIDTINVIERAHHHTLWTRRPDYDPQFLHDLQAKDRRIFEYWGHAASYLPLSDYCFYLPLMHSFQEPHNSWERKRFEKYGHLMPSVLERVRQEGPLSSKDFTPPPGTKRGTWWDWKPAKVALELLFWRGELMVTERRNFQRVYDLTERVLPPEIDTSQPTQTELGQFLVRRALAAFGLAQPREIYDHIRAAKPSVIAQAITELVESGEVVPIKIENNNGDYYTKPEILEKAHRLQSTQSVLHFLSPFDNLVIHRQRLKHLFGFDYALECYLPTDKRQFGYFTLPILWGEKLVGRLDPKADRVSKKLIIRNLAFEPQFQGFEGLLPVLATHLQAFARFNRCQAVVLERLSPASIKSDLERNLFNLKNS